MIPQDVISKLKEQHGEDLHLLSQDGVEMVFRRPAKEAYRRFRAKSMAEGEGTARGDAAETLVYACLVYPEAGAATAAFEKQYGLVDTFASRLLKLAGATRDCEAVPL